MSNLTRHDLACALDLLERLERTAGEPHAFVQAAVHALAQFIAAEGDGQELADVALPCTPPGATEAAAQFRDLYKQACEAARAADARAGPLLTRREGDVMRWLACGKTDAEIGALLAISPRTVHKHLQHVYEKLGVETRTAAVMALQRRTTDASAGNAPGSGASFSGRT